MMRRYLNRNGTFNVSRQSSSGIHPSDLYHSLISLSQRRFIALVVMVYGLINLVFGFLFYFCGPEGLMGVRSDSAWHRYSDCFFFSVQTLATIGYGRISPAGLVPNLLVTIEAFVGLLSLAVVTGLFFARFSRPTARVIFSHVALMSRVDGQPAMVFRMANQRMNQIVEPM